MACMVYLTISHPISYARKLLAPTTHEHRHNGSRLSIYKKNETY